MNTSTEHRKLAAIMFTDMVGYSALSQRNEALALELLEEHRRIVRDILPKHGGREVKTTGDGFLIEFPSALAAVQCAVDVQAALHTRNLQVGRGVPTAPEAERPARSASPTEILIRIGIHVGDVVVRDGDVHGDGVNLAARIEPLAGPGGICLSRQVHDQVANKIEAQLAPLGRAELKNIEGGLEIFRVVLPWQRGAPVRVALGRDYLLSRALPWAMAAVLAVAFLISRFSARRDENRVGAARGGGVLRKFELTLPQPAAKAADAHGLHLAISPDGRKLAYANADGLWLRWLDRVAPSVLLHAGPAVFDPFWSPQSTDIGFFDDRKVYRIPIEGGRPMLLGTAPQVPKSGLTGGAWLPGERVIFATGMSALFEVPAQGGKVSTALALADGDLDFHHASALPGGVASCSSCIRTPSAPIRSRSGRRRGSGRFCCACQAAGCSSLFSQWQATFFSSGGTPRAVYGPSLSRWRSSSARASRSACRMSETSPAWRTTGRWFTACRKGLISRRGNWPGWIAPGRCWARSARRCPASIRHVSPRMGGGSSPRLANHR